MQNSFEGYEKQKSPGSDGITTQFYKIFWNDIKEKLHKFYHFFLSKWRTYGITKTKYYYTLAKKMEKTTYF